MTRKTVRVEVPTSKPDKFISLAEAINSKHQSLGEASPLLSLNKMDVFSGNLGEGKQLRDESKELKRSSESKMEEAMIKLGFATGQTSETPDTVYNLLLRVRDLLLVTYRGNEEKLSEWGFKVVVGQAKTGRRQA